MTAAQAKDEEKSEITKLQEALQLEQQAHMKTKKELHEVIVFLASMPEQFNRLGKGENACATALFNYATAIQGVTNAYFQEQQQQQAQQQQQQEGEQQ